MGEECPVCLEEIERAVWCKMPCDHKICFRCMLKMWEHSRQACPMCRHDIQDCLPAPRPAARQMIASNEASPNEDEWMRTTNAGTSSMRGMSFWRRVHLASAMENALRTQRIAPRNAPLPLSVTIPPSNVSTPNDDDDDDRRAYDFPNEDE